MRADIIYTAKSWADFSETVRAPSQTLLNLRAGISPSDKYSVEIYGRNLTQETAFSADTLRTITGPGRDRKAFANPYQRREFGFRVTANF